MATTNLRATGTKYPALPKGGTILLEKQIDFSDDNGGANDVFQLFDITAGTLIIGVSIEVETGEGATSTIEVGLSAGGTTDSTFMTGASIETAVWLVGDGADGDAPATIVTSMVLVDTIFVLETNTAATDTAVINVKVLVADMTGELGLDPIA